MKTILFAFLIYLSSCLNLSGQQVLFGEREIDTTDFSFYIDNQGMLYPEFRIENSRIKEAGGNLNSFYAKNSTAFDSICTAYSIALTDSYEKRVSMLQEAIIRQKTLRFIQPSDICITIMVHGFGKSYDEYPGKINSVLEFSYEKYNLTTNQLQSDHYISVYWDASFECCFSLNKKRNKEIFGLFEQAQKDAIKAGTAVRAIISQLPVPVVNIIGHSLGSKVVASALFNLEESSLPAPLQQHINIAMVAPAINGQEVFSHYYQRPPKNYPTQPDNYTLFILYNEKDYVLKKKDNQLGLFGPGVKKYGNTALGCNYKGDAVQTKDMILSMNPEASVFLQKITSIGKQHSLIFYLKADELNPFISFVNQMIEHVKKDKK